MLSGCMDKHSGRARHPEPHKFHAWGAKTKMPKSRLRLSDTDLDFIAANTAYKDRELLRVQFDNFCEKHPEGHITKKDFRAMMRTCYPGR